jgi:ElaB/YqjD/DUF883 family membrane-anchored ribosome-binding protein
MEWNENAGTSFGEGSMDASMNTGSGTTIDDAKEKARQAATDAQHKLADELRTRVESSRTRAADALGSVANALSQSGQQLRSDNQAAPSDYVERAGNQIRRASDYLRNTNTDEIVRNAENFARRQPAVFLGGAFVLGLLAARLVKSTQTGAGYNGGIQRDHALVPGGSPWTGDRETAVSGYREPGTSAGSAFAGDTDPSYTREFGRETL